MTSARTRVLTKWTATVVVSIAFIVVGAVIGQPVIWVIGLLLLLGDLLLISFGLFTVRRVRQRRSA